MKDKLETLKRQILAALRHPEAEDGLYFQNLCAVHEEEERPSVQGDQDDILDALKMLIEEGRVRVDDSGKELVFYAADLT